MITSPTTSRPRAATSIVVVALLAGLLAQSGRAAGREDALDAARTALDAGEPERARSLVDSALRRGKPSGEALLLRSNAGFMLGDQERATADLRRALELDPTLRQGWLNLAGVEIAVERYDAAHQALLRAQALDPEALDNDLNLGAVLLLGGHGDRAEAHFERYLARLPGDAEACFQVAGNYALAGDVTRAVDVLRRALALDERLRMRVRSDRRFSFFEHPAFRALMNQDRYQPPAGAHTVAAAFRVPYDRQDQVLIHAVLDALRELGEPFDPAVEATDGWTLIWGDMRIKLANQANGTGLVSLSAAAERFTAEDWHRRSQQLFRAIHEHVARALAAG